MSNAVKTLRREVKRAKGVKAGTVVTFDRTITFLEGMRRDEERVQTFSYAALFVGGRWYFTGKGGLGNEAMTNSAFIERMAAEDISNVRVVTETEAL